MFEHAIRECLNQTAQRRMAVLRPLKLVIDNYPVEVVEELVAVNNPEDAASGTRRIPFGRGLYVEAEDLWNTRPGVFTGSRRAGR